MNDQEFQAALTRWSETSRLSYLRRINLYHHLEQRDKAFWEDMFQRELFALHTDRILENEWTG